MSYAIDVYRRQVRTARNFVHYIAFVSMFPHLIAGPDRALRRPGRPAPPPGAAADRGPGRLGALLLRHGHGQEAAVRRRAGALRRTACGCTTPHLGLGGAWAAVAGLHACSSTSTSRATRTWPWAWPACWASASRRTSTRPTRRQHLRLLAALAHVAVVLVPRLRLHPARRLAARPLAQPGQPRDRHAARPDCGTAPRWTFVVWGLLHGVYLAVHAVCRRAGLTPRWPG